MTLGRPKVATFSGPSSLAWGMKSPLASLQDLVALTAMFAAGFASRVKLVRLGPSRYLPRLNLTAVLPLPNRSYEAPRRRVTFFQSGTLSTSGNVTLRFGTQGPGPKVEAGTDLLRR